MRKAKMNLEKYDEGAAAIGKALDQMGYESLREGQREPIDCIMYGRDTICIMPTGAGKCLARNTPVLLADGCVLPVQYICSGDELVAPDGAGTVTVLSVTQGKDQMYTVTPERGDPFRCNSAHMLSMSIRTTEPVEGPNGHIYNDGDLIDIPAEVYVASSDEFKACTRMLRSGAVQFKGAAHVNLPPPEELHEELYDEYGDLLPISHTYKVSSIHVRESIMRTIMQHAPLATSEAAEPFRGGISTNSRELEIYSPQAIEDVLFIARSLGWEAYNTGASVLVTPPLDWCQNPYNTAMTFTVTKDIVDSYYGFMVSGDEGRFLLGDFTITHNSAIFAIPTIAMKWKTIVFSPLIALMRDQVQSMNKAGIRTGCINSSQSEIQNITILREWSEGKLQMLYVAPERLSNPQFRQAMLAERPSFVVLDEAHTLSSWSDNFRPAYQGCGQFIEDFNPDVVAAFTATATDEVIADVKRVLRIPDACVARYYPPRLNLHLSSEVLPDSSRLDSIIIRYVRKVKGSCIVYCQTVAEVTRIHKLLSDAGESVTNYHGQIKSAGEKEINQDSFMSGRSRICVATNAFGMGIDKPDIELILHVGPPGSVEAVSQEVGRAARDGRDAICHMIMTPASQWMQEFFWAKSNPDGVAVLDTYNYLLKVCDSDGVAYATAETIGDHIESTCAAGALMFLQSRNCVHRFEPTAKMYTITHLNKPLESVPKSCHALYEAIPEGGTVVGTTDEGYKIYKIDLAFLVSRTGVLDQTVRTKLRTLQKEGFITFVPPFSGKATKLLTPPTDEDIEQADAKRNAEMKKIADVRTYVRTPDAEKQKFLQDYFAIDGK